MNSHMVREGFSSYYVVPRVEGHEYAERIIREQNCSVILPFEMRRVDDISCYYYKVSGMFSLKKKLVGNKMNMEDYRKVYQSIIEAVEELESFLLPAEDLVLDSSVIFCEETKSRLKFCYQPGMGKDLVEQLRLLTEEFLEYMDYENQEMVSEMYQIHDQLTKGVFPKQLLIKQVSHTEPMKEIMMPEQKEPERIDLFENEIIEEIQEHDTKWKIEMAVSMAVSVGFIFLFCYYLVSTIRLGMHPSSLRMMLVSFLLLVVNSIYLVRKILKKPVKDIPTTIFNGEPFE
ncbi:MAG: DUF6382 domain-containing protein [Lachnospiraceae bacterium]|nr:DUF6382 domain-containing protein [Lachnospiraceae bacterium]